MTMSVNKALPMEPHVSRLVRPVTVTYLILSVLIITRFINVVCGLHISATYHVHNVQVG